MERKNNLSELMSATMSRVRDLVDVNTIVGEPITTADGSTIIPVTRLTMGFGSGGSDFGQSGNFGGGGGAGVKVTPVAFLVVTEQNVRLLPMTGQGESTFDKVADMIPKITSQIEKLVDKYKKEE